jgi:hypothetical protein
LRDDDELRARSRAQLRLQRVPREVNRLVQVRRAGFGVEVGPDGGDHLLAMQPVTGFEREQLDEQLRLAPRPRRLGDRAPANGDAKVTEQSNFHGRGRRRRGHRKQGAAQSSRPLKTTGQN